MAAPADSIVGFVWQDLNADGIQDVGEPGMGNVTVNLYDPGADMMPGGGDDVGLSSTTTFPTGDYIFSSLTTPESYFVEFIIPGGSGLVFSPQGQGGDPLKDSNADMGTGYTAVISLSDGEGREGIDAGMHPPTTIGDRVWNDLNADGIQDGGEPGLGGVDVNLFTSGDALAGNTTTIFNGSYSFSGIAPGDYYVQFVLPAGFIFSPKDQGVDYADSDPDTATGETDVFSVTVGANKDDIDAGLFQPATIGNLAWDDTDGNGIQDGGEIGISGVAVSLYKSDDSFVDSTSTDANGVYTFTNLIPNTYYLQFTQPGGYLTSPKDIGGSDILDSDIYTGTGKTDNFVVAFGEVQSDMDAGYFLPGSIGDFIWNDLNGDGVQDGGGETGFTGVTIDLIHDLNGNGLIDGGEPILTNQVTDGTGAYDFTNLPARDYIINVTDVGAVLTGYAITGGTNPQAVTLTAGQDYDGADFGYQEQDASIGDFVWNDLNGDGIQDGGGEAGIDGVTVDLIIDANGNGVKDGGETAFTTDTTSGGGAYDFTNLAVGDYLVEVTDTGAVLTGFTLTGGTNPHAVTITAGQDYDGADFGYQQQDASIGDFVWNDLNGNGTQDGGGEVGIDGVTVDLIIDANGNGVKDGGETAF
ncbi:MAG: hypothetical protein GY943_08570, partial [Chloroflexi bacterium]|nr:hypothetical protein [Chloroflexota bacterium]